MKKNSQQNSGTLFGFECLSKVLPKRGGLAFKIEHLSEASNRPYFWLFSFYKEKRH